MKGPLIILSGPSGCGKSTVISRLVALGDLPMHLSVSATTRKPRHWERNGVSFQEQDGVHYHFWTPSHFEEEIRAGAFLEWARVFGNYYGTLRREVEPYREQGQAVILDIDVQGAAQVRQKCPDQVSVFLRTSSWETYERRLRTRGTEDEAAIQRRLATARAELQHAAEYDYQVFNDDLDQAVAQFHALVKQQFERDPHAG